MRCCWFYSIFVQFMHGSSRKRTRPFAFQWIIAATCERMYTRQSNACARARWPEPESTISFSVFLGLLHCILCYMLPFRLLLSIGISFSVSQRISRQVLSYAVCELQCGRWPRRIGHGFTIREDGCIGGPQQKSRFFSFLFWSGCEIVLLLGRGLQHSLAGHGTSSRQPAGNSECIWNEVWVFASSIVF